MLLASTNKVWIDVRSVECMSVCPMSCQLTMTTHSGNTVIANYDYIKDAEADLELIAQERDK